MLRRVWLLTLGEGVLRQTLARIRDGCIRRRCNDGYKRIPDAISDNDFEEKRQPRDDHDTTAKADQGSEEPSHHGRNKQ